MAGGRSWDIERVGAFRMPFRGLIVDGEGDYGWDSWSTPGPVRALMEEADKLYEDVLRDVVAKSWSRHGYYVRRYNELAIKAHRVGGSRRFQLAEAIPSERQEVVGTYPTSGRRMLLEILQRLGLLQDDLRLLNPAMNSERAIARVLRLCDSFHRIALELALPQHGRDGLSIRDEYDVQRLLRALIIGDFEDVRREEPTPSMAGGSARTDFLIMPHGIVVETKMARKGFSDKELGDQLLVDVERYRVHPRCSTLICFAYDPDNYIRNRGGLCADLERFSNEDFLVRIIIRPRT